jgi:hypothetical protein
MRPPYFRAFLNEEFVADPARRGASAFQYLTFGVRFTRL